MSRLLEVVSRLIGRNLFKFRYTTLDQIALHLSTGGIGSISDRTAASASSLIRITVRDALLLAVKGTILVLQPACAIAHVIFMLLPPLLPVRYQH